jgi:hypothetical protein
LGPPVRINGIRYYWQLSMYSSMADATYIIV